MIHIGFGTMNGRDGKPFKTRDGGVMRLEKLIADIDEAVYQRIMENRTVSEDEARETAKVVGLAALKYGDLSNQAAKDYVFDLERFISFEGNTGPYILYTIVRIKSILGKYLDQKQEEAEASAVLAPSGSGEKALMLELAKYNEVMENALQRQLLIRSVSISLIYPTHSTAFTTIPEFSQRKIRPVRPAGFV